MGPVAVNISLNQTVSYHSEMPGETDEAQDVPRHSPGALSERPDIGGMARLTPALRAVAAAASALDTVAPGLTTEIMLRHFTPSAAQGRAGTTARSLPPGAHSP
jgi:hypothetical protein